VLRLLLVCLGGALGSGARYLVSGWAASRYGLDFPRGTLVVNVTGSFLLGVLVAVGTLRGLSDDLRLLLGAGVLGGFTTYSSFNAETIALAERAGLVPAAANVLLTVVGSLVAGALGLWVVRAVAA
jgi:CrcB protein